LACTDREVKRSKVRSHHGYVNCHGHMAASGPVAVVLLLPCVDCMLDDCLGL